MTLPIEKLKKMDFYFILDLDFLDLMNIFTTYIINTN